MSAIPRPLIIKLDTGRRRRADRITMHLSKAGFQVINATTVEEGLKLGERATPQLIIAIDDLRNGLDAERWLYAQHSSHTSTLPMVPLLILTQGNRIQQLQVHELPDRVRILPSSISPSRLLEEVQHILARWLF